MQAFKSIDVRHLHRRFRLFAGQTFSWVWACAREPSRSIKVRTEEDALVCPHSTLPRPAPFIMILNPEVLTGPFGNPINLGAPDFLLGVSFFSVLKKDVLVDSAISLALLAGCRYQIGLLLGSLMQRRLARQRTQLTKRR